MITDADLRNQEPPLSPPWAPPAGSPAETPEPPPTAPARARWERPALISLLVVTAAMYVWGLSASGWANSFYSAAAQAGSQSWKAWFFGASDAASSITVDKPPAALWITGLSVRIFGLNSWSVLVPEALMGVATVGLVYAAVRRRFSAWAALLAGAVMATTPVAALMFRFNNPDALLVLLMTIAAYATMRGIEDGRRRWIVIAGVAIGFGFLAKQLQVVLVVPPLALAYLVAAPHMLWRRIRDLLVGGAAMVASAGWWVLIVLLVPASMRPYIGGSQDNNILELTLGYNGFGRLTGNETGSVGTGQWGVTGITRMFDGVIGGQIAWLIPAALIGGVAGLWITRRAARTSYTRAAVIAWGGWLVVTGVVFSFMEGIFHEYYTVALAPAIAVLVGIGADLLWRRRHEHAARMVLAGAVLVTALWSASLLGRAPTWMPGLRPLVVAGGVVAAIGIAAGNWVGTKVVTASAVAGAVVALTGPTAWALNTVATPHSGAIVTAGPAVEGGRFGPGRMPGRGVFAPGTTGAAGGGAGAGGGGAGAGGTGAFPGIAGNGGFGGFPGVAGGAGGVGGAGGLLNGSTPSDEVVAVLNEDSDQYTWVAAAVGSNEASGFQLATQHSVMPIGGFNGSDPSPTLEQFKEYVAEGKIHYFIAGGGFGRQMGGSNEAQSIADWVTTNFTSTTVDGVTLYDLTS
jgi:4-amino-4-deoxy-L-arabinose transferase-like glycosyltransferase